MEDEIKYEAQSAVSVTSLSEIRHEEVNRRFDKDEAALAEHIEDAKEIIADVIGAQENMMRLIEDLQESHRTMQRMMLVLLGLICLVAVFVGLHFVRF